MISDNDLYQLAIFLGSCAMLLIVLYHFLEANSKASPGAFVKAAAAPNADASSSSPTTIDSPPTANSSDGGGSSMAGGKRR
jgi:oligosaccharyl transferase complex subunit OST4